MGRLHSAQVDLGWNDILLSNAVMNIDSWLETITLYMENDPKKCFKDIYNSTRVSVPVPIQILYDHIPSTRYHYSPESDIAGDEQRPKEERNE